MNAGCRMDLPDAGMPMLDTGKEDLKNFSSVLSSDQYLND